MSLEVELTEVIEHALTIISGHTSMNFAGRDVDPFIFGEQNERVAPVTFFSDTKKITGGPIGLVATSVRVQISTSAFFRDDGKPVIDSLVALQPNDQHQATVVFIFTRPDGNEFSVPRTIHFRGPYFLRFD